MRAAVPKFGPPPVPIFVPRIVHPERIKWDWNADPAASSSLNRIVSARRRSARPAWVELLVMILGGGGDDEGHLPAGRDTPRFQK